MLASSRHALVAAGLALLSACASGPAARPVAAPAPRPTEAAPPPPSAASTRVPPVAAPKRPVVHTYFGETVIDEYEWLEDGVSAEVRAFTDAQNALTRTTLDGLPERDAVKARVASIYETTSADWTSVQWQGRRLFALKSAPPKQQQILVELGAPRSSSASPVDLASERVVVDPNVLDPSGKTTIDFFVPSPDGRLVAVSLSKDGSESGDLHLFDVATGKERASETIPRVQGGTAGGSVAWDADGYGFHYTR